jgi:DNA-directed RNA polymerase subunit beta
MKKTPKIPIFIFLKAIGFTHKTIFSNFANFIQFIPHYSKPEEESIFGNLDTYLVEENKLVQSSIFQKFLNIQSYDLGLNGRMNINQKLGLNIHQTTLTPLDCLRITHLLLHLHNNKIKFDDIDDLSNRRVRTIGELLQIQVHQALYRFQKLLTEKDKKSDILPYLGSTKPFNSTMKEFFSSCVLSQFLDQVNPLAELTHKRRISALGPNGIKRETAGMDIRSIHSTYFGRLCPIETPEGKNAGLVNSLAIFTSTNKHGFLQVPYNQVINGQVQKYSPPILMDADQEKPFRIILADHTLSDLNFLSNVSYTMRHYQKLIRTQLQRIQFCAYSNMQLISVATSLIPFMEHNDANRVLMGSNMQRQAIPLLYSDASNIYTFLESRVISDTCYSQRAHQSGIILYTSQRYLKLYCESLIKSTRIDKINNKGLTINSFKLANLLNHNNFNTFKVYPFLKFKNYTRIYLSNIDINYRRKIDSNSYVYSYRLTKIYNLHLIYKRNRPIYRVNKFNYFKLLKANNSNTKNKTYRCKTGYPNPYQINRINLQTFEKTNQGTLQFQKPIVSTFEWLHKGDFICDCASSENGRLALGRNLLVAYLPWEGYNFEDAIILNEKLVLNEKFISIHIEKYEFEIQENKYGWEIITRDLPFKNKNLSHLDKNGIIKLGSSVTSGLLLIGKVAPIEPRQLLPHEKLLYDIVGKKVDKTKDVSLYAPSTIEGRVIYITVNNNIYDPKLTSIEQCTQICLYIAEKRNLQVGDKLSGRHGNKGVISQILPDQDLPFLLNGQTIDIVLNPLGVPSRMNVGQLFEALLGLASKKLKEDYKVEIFDEKYGFDTSRSLVYYKLIQLRKQSKQRWYFSKNFPGKMFLFDGRTGEKFFEPIMVGETYILKLIHMVEEKIHARSTGPYSLVTQQPLKGRSKHGGQRFGEMEVWALEGFGSAYILHELLTIKSDDTVGRTKILATLLNNKDMYFGTPESFKVLLRELQSLCLNVQVCERIL